MIFQRKSCGDPLALRAGKLTNSCTETRPRPTLKNGIAVSNSRQDDWPSVGDPCVCCRTLAVASQPWEVGNDDSGSTAAALVYSDVVTGRPEGRTDKSRISHGDLTRS